MKGTLSIVVAILAIAAPPLRAAEPNQLTPEQIAAGWINLFDGETLFGWTPTSDANWKVEDAAITVSEGEPGFLMTGSEFADYELHVEFKAPATTNSGVFLRTPLAPTDPAKDCFELNIAPQNNPFPTGSLVARRKWAQGLLASNLSSAPPMIGTGEQGGKDKPRAAASDKAVTAAEAEPPKPAAAAPAANGDAWHAFDLRLSGDSIDVCLDGRRLYVHRDDVGPLRGRIGLQFREGPVAFRNIRLRPLGMKPMLNGKDLAGWNTEKVEVAKFEVTPGGRESFATSDSDSEDPAPVAKDSRPLPELHVTGGRGQLETEASYGDFILQLDAFVDGDGLNSGVFFRSIPREFTQGYESQIQNAVKDNDPTKPVDAGTGAIYRRTTARRVVSKDREWFTKTIVATGPHIAVWVNGHQVTDWTDDRPPHDNPRSGLRTAPGTISLQAHDPTTNLRFRNLRIAELPEAKPIED